MGQPKTWREYQRRQNARARRWRWPFSARGAALLCGLLVAFAAMLLLVFGCDRPNTAYAVASDLAYEPRDLTPAVSPPDLVALPTPDLGRIEVIAYDLSPTPAADLARASDLARAYDFASTPDLAPAPCTPLSAACSTDAECCADPLPGQIDSSEYCQASKCCAMSRIGNGCVGGHFKWCTNCGVGWTCGLCS